MRQDGDHLDAGDFDPILTILTMDDEARGVRMLEEQSRQVLEGAAKCALPARAQGAAIMPAQSAMVEATYCVTMAWFNGTPCAKPSIIRHR